MLLKINTLKQSYVQSYDVDLHNFKWQWNVQLSWDMKSWWLRLKDFGKIYEESLKIPARYSSENFVFQLQIFIKKWVCLLSHLNFKTIIVQGLNLSCTHHQLWFRTPDYCKVFKADDGSPIKAAIETRLQKNISLVISLLRGQGRLAALLFTWKLLLKNWPLEL